MDLNVARFDLDERPRPSNTHRQTPAGAALPTDFPFLIDIETAELVEPVLLHLAAKFGGLATWRNGVWTKKNQADAAAADLRDWWIYLHEKGVRWDSVSTKFLGRYLTDFLTTPSAHTKDFISDSTFKRRCSSIDEFHAFARERWPEGSYPSGKAARMLAGDGPNARHSSDDNAHPIDPTHARQIARRLGPFPSERKGKQSSALRLAFEIGVTVGLRIDEILHLPPELLQAMNSAGRRRNKVHCLRITKTKGLRPRTVHFPNWLVREIQTYIDTERKEALAHGRIAWMQSNDDAPKVLLLNPATSREDAGKRLRAATMQKKFAAAQVELGITVPRERAVGHKLHRIEEGPAHDFHDTRHTYAHWTYLSLVRQGHSEPWLFLRNRLGHRHLKTTTDTYLTAFNELGPEALEALQRHFAEIRRRTR
jgi:integrase